MFTVRPDALTSSTVGGRTTAHRHFSAKASLGTLLVISIGALFLLRASARGELWRWACSFATMSEDWCWVMITMTSAAVVVCPRLLTPFIWIVFGGLAVCGDIDMFLRGVAWAAQGAAIYNELLWSFADFVGCIISISCLCGAAQGVYPIDWIAAAAVQLWILYLFSLLVGPKFLRRRSRRMSEITLQRALDSPFHAEFDDGFSKGEDVNPRPSLSAEPVCSIPAAETKIADPKGCAGRLYVLLQSRKKILEEQYLKGLADVLPDKLELKVRRSHILEDSWNALLEASKSELLSPVFTVTYVGEEGVDSGGLLLDWFDGVGQALAEGADHDNGTSLLALGKSSRMLIPRPGPRRDLESSARETDRFRDFLMVGRFLALGVVHSARPLPCPISPLVCKYILGVPVDKTDLKWLDADFYRARVAPLLRQGGLTRLEAELGEPLTFTSTPTEHRPEPEELEPNGSSTVVTEGNLPRYLQLLCDAFLCNEIRQELQCLLQGFWDVLPIDALQESKISVAELVALIAGSQNLDVGEWRRCAQEEEDGIKDDQDPDRSADSEKPRNESSAVLSWFWAALDEFDKEQRQMLLHFVTGSGRLPPGGFSSLHPPFTVAVTSAGSSSHLPHANTCSFNMGVFAVPSSAFDARFDPPTHASWRISHLLSSDISKTDLISQFVSWRKMALHRLRNGREHFSERTVLRC